MALRLQTAWLLEGKRASLAVASVNCGLQIRRRSYSQRRISTFTPAQPFADNTPSLDGTKHSHAESTEMPSRAALSILPLTSILRSIAILSVSASPTLLKPSLYVMGKLAHSTGPILSPDRNPLLRWIIRRSLYVQFCAGENGEEVRSTTEGLKALGYRGVILNYAKEVAMSKEQMKIVDDVAQSTIPSRDLETWLKGTLDTIRFTDEGDYVAVKFSGAGSQALYHLTHTYPPPKSFADSITEICELAAKRKVRLLFDAEQQSIQGGIDAWTLDYMRLYNKEPGKAVVYGTYQTYLKATPKILAKHLDCAKREGFTLGVKLVRGAYLGTDPRHLINNTKEDTDKQFDGVTESLMKRHYNSTLKPENPDYTEMPRVNLILASHNQESVRKARSISLHQDTLGEKQIDVAYAQLMGMADEVSCEILQSRHDSSGTKPADAPAYKYLAWGTTGECMKYLLRRAEENRDAVARTRTGRDALVGEVWRRMKTSLGFA